MYSPETVDQMQDELLALVEAWSDRGIPPSDASMMIAGTSHLMIMKFSDLTFEEMVEMMREQWDKHLPGLRGSRG